MLGNKEFLRSLSNPSLSPQEQMLVLNTLITSKEKRSHHLRVMAELLENPNLNLHAAVIILEMAPLRRRKSTIYSGLCGSKKATPRTFEESVALGSYAGPDARLPTPLVKALNASVAFRRWYEEDELSALKEKSSSAYHQVMGVGDEIVWMPNYWGDLANGKINLIDDGLLEPLEEI